MKILLKTPLGSYSGYGNDGCGLAQALLRLGIDVYIAPEAVGPPIPPAVAHLLTKRLDGPFDLTIHHSSPSQLNLSDAARAATGAAVAWTMWEYTTIDNLPERDTLTKRLANFDLVLGYDSVSTGALRPHAATVGTLQGGYWAEAWPPAQRDWHGDRFGFCMVGQLHQRKDPFVAIQAFKELRDEHPDFTAELHLKAQPLDARVLTPWGWVAMGELRVGDVICDTRGGVQSVQGVYPQGEQDIYEVQMVGGAKTRCTLDHLWLTRTPHSRIYRAKRLSQMLDEGLTTGSAGLLRHRIPLPAPTTGMQRPCRHDTIDPYVLGLLLGDGGMTQGVVHYSSADEELIKAVSDCAAALGCMLVKEPSRKYDHRIVRVGRTGRNAVTEVMRSLGLMGLGAQQKHIPPQYLFMSAEDRLALLRGLMDTDGTVGTSVTFSTVSPDLADGVVALVRSLGGVASCTTPYRGRYRLADGTSHDAAMVYPVRITMNCCPFSLPRKVEAWTKLWAKRRHSYENKINAVRSAGRAQAVCIKVSGPEQTYITDDYIVTHNTNVPGLHPEMQQWCPGLHVHYAVWPTDQLRAFYGRQHVLLAPSRGEGKNVPALEFMSTGGTVIATNWGGSTQWLHGSCAYPLRFTLESESPATPDCKSARADKDHLKELMRHVYTNRAEAARKGATAAQLIPQMCSWDAVLDRLFNLVAEHIPTHGAQLQHRYRHLKAIRQSGPVMAGG